MLPGKSSHNYTMVMCPHDQEVVEFPDSRKSGVLVSQDLTPSVHAITFNGKCNSRSA